jgi:hypothetical protein
MEIANAVEAVQDSRIFIEVLNGPFLYEFKGSPAEYGAGLKLAILIEMDKRLPAAGVMALPMSRLDIADYLGLRLEKVSRALSFLQDRGVLDFIGKSQREIVLRDRVRLQTFDFPM